MNQQTIYIFFGLIASGKSTLAELFAAEHGFPSYNTDRIRKELVGIAATERRPDGMGQGIYSPEFTKKTYQAMLTKAAQELNNRAAGVVLDGSYSRASDRHKVRQLALSFTPASTPNAQQTVRTLFILCSCSNEETRRRLEQRAKDPNAVSDGRWDIFAQQKKKFEQPDELSSNQPQQLVCIDTEEKSEQLLKLLNRQIKI
jgi:predicted kinase